MRYHNFTQPRKIMENNILDKAKTWLTDLYDEQTRQEVQQMIDHDPQSLTDAFYTDLDFGTGGLRGIMGAGTNRMNIYTVSIATQGLANYLNQSFPGGAIKVAIAHDSRNNSPLFARKAAEVLSANGIKVYLFPTLRPTPQLSFAVRELNCQGGIVITASHNPKEYNGYKVYWNDGGQVVPPHDKNIINEVKAIQSIADVKTSPKESLILPVPDDIDQRYLNMIKQLSFRNGAPSNLKIAYTALHGTGTTLMPQILNDFGFTEVFIEEQQAIPDGNFPTVKSPNPEEAEALDRCIALAIEKQADLVLGTDPDSDRVGIAIKMPDQSFKLLNGNQTACLLIHYYLTAWDAKKGLKGHEFIARTIVTTPLIDRIAAHFGVDLEVCLTGFKWIAELIRENESKRQYLIGGEESYGYLIGDKVRDKDAIASAALIAETAAWAAENGMTMFDLLIDVYLKYGYFQEHLVSLTKKGKSGAEEIAAMMENWRNNPPKSLDGIPVIEVKDYQLRQATNLADGSNSEIQLPASNVIQLVLADGSLVTARPSGTEPKIKFYFSVKGELMRAEDFAQAEINLKSKIARIVSELHLN